MYKNKHSHLNNYKYLNNIQHQKTKTPTFKF